MSKTYYCVTSKTYEDGTVLAGVTHKRTAEEIPEDYYISKKYFFDGIPGDTVAAMLMWENVSKSVIGMQTEGVTEIFQEWFDDITIAKNITENIEWYHKHQEKWKEVRA